MSVSIPVSTNPNKRPRLAKDRFTNLHEHLVSNILSRLPTKDAVRTSILSKAWEDKWTSLYNVNIDGEIGENFVNFMNNVFASTEQLRSVRLLFMEIGGYETWTSSFQNWIHESLRHNLVCFEVFHRNEDIFYPSFLLNETSLRKLVLGSSNTSPSILNLEPSHGTLYVSSVNCAPNLTSVSLGPLSIINENSFCTTVTFDFPVLQTLTFNQCKWLNVEHVKINAPALTAFTSQVIKINNGDDDDYYDYAIEVVSPTPRLTTFKCTSEKIILDGSSIVSASLTLKGIDVPRVREIVGSRVRNLLNTFSNLEELELSGHIMAEVPSLWRYDKLTRLTLRSMGICVSKQLFELLHGMPSLKFLSIKDVLLWDDSKHVAAELVPSCISSQLEEVVIRGFYEVSRYFVVFLLTNATQLKKLTVGRPSSDVEKTKSVLSTFYSSSSTLVIEVVNIDEIPY